MTIPWVRPPAARLVRMQPCLAILALVGASSVVVAQQVAPTRWAPPPDWHIKPTDRRVEALVYTMEGGAINPGGLSAQGVVDTCRGWVKLGMASTVPELPPGHDQASPYSSITVVTLAGDRLANFGQARRYRHQYDATTRGGPSDICSAPFSYDDERASDHRLSTSTQSAYWAANLTDGHGRHFKAGPGIVPLVTKRLDPAMAARAGAVRQGMATVAGWQCERWRFPDRHEACVLAAQPGIPGYLLHLIVELTPAPHLSPAAQQHFRLTSLVPKVLVDEGVFQPPDVPYRGSSRSDAAGAAGS